MLKISFIIVGVAIAVYAVAISYKYIYDRGQAAAYQKYEQSIIELRENIDNRLVELKISVEDTVKKSDANTRKLSKDISNIKINIDPDTYPLCKIPTPWMDSTNILTDRINDEILN